LANWDAVVSGAIKIGVGTFKVVAGTGILVASGASAAFSGGTATPAAVAGAVVGGTWVADGFFKATTGAAEVLIGLAGEESLGEDMPTCISQILGIFGDEFAEAFTGKESDVGEKIGKWIGNLPIGVLDLLLNPTDAHAPRVGDMDEQSDPFEGVDDLIDQENE